MMSKKARKGLRISVASGKGGTGKTLVATNLATAARVWLADLDVEAPNCHLFLGCSQGVVKGAFRPVPQVRQDLCDHCGICAQSCQFGAIVALLDKTLVQEESCHGCGACLQLCPRGAITMHQRRMGDITKCHEFGRGLVYGELRIGEPSAVPLIKMTKAEIPAGSDAVMDCPPGNGCPTAESVRGADLCLLVTEPTAFGLHDLDLALRLASKLGVPTAVFINKEGVGDVDLASFCEDREVEVIGRLPFSREIAQIYSRGGLLVEKNEHLTFFEGLWERCKEVAGR